MTALNIPHLLRMLDVNHPDPAVSARLHEAQNLLDKGQAVQAIELGRVVSRLAVRAVTADKRSAALEAQRRSVVGSAFLHLAYLRSQTQLPGEQELAVHDARVAVTWLSHDEERLVLAELILALIAQYDRKTLIAVEYLRRARALLDKLIAERQHQGKNDQAAKYQRLRVQVIHNITRLPLPRPPAEEQPSIDQSILRQLPIPARLVWLGVDPPGVQLMTVFDTIGSPASVTLLPKPLKEIHYTLDSIEVDQVSIDGRPYRVQGILEQAGGKFQFQTGQPYYAYALADVARRPGGASHVLVRRQTQPVLPSSQPIVIIEPVKQQAWLVESNPSSDPNIIGARQWIINDGTETLTYREANVRVVGVVEAVLTPIAISPFIG
jgi:hypothetical protein